MLVLAGLLLAVSGVRLWQSAKGPGMAHEPPYSPSDITWKSAVLVGGLPEDRSFDEPANMQMEPTRLTVRAIMSPRHAAQAAR
jgi:hypothetical protein